MRGYYTNGHVHNQGDMFWQDHFQHYLQCMKCEESRQSACRKCLSAFLFDHGHGNIAHKYNNHIFKKSSTPHLLNS